jgi:CubicO group peptidase (beta-lactamase class C family)
MRPFFLDPLAATSHTPIYSNAGYQILGYALEEIAKADYEDVLTDRLIKPLNLTRSGLQPQPAFGVILSNETYSYFNFAFGDEEP